MYAFCLYTVVGKLLSPTGDTCIHTVLAVIFPGEPGWLVAPLLLLHLFLRWFGRIKMILTGSNVV